MSISTPVPADVEATSIIDLVEDCREIEGLLAPYVPHTIRLPEARAPWRVEITSDVAAGFDGYDSYGS